MSKSSLLVVTLPSSPIFVLIFDFLYILFLLSISCQFMFISVAHSLRFLFLAVNIWFPFLATLGEIHLLSSSFHFYHSLPFPLITSSSMFLGNSLLFFDCWFSYFAPIIKILLCNISLPLSTHDLSLFVPHASWNDPFHLHSLL